MKGMDSNITRGKETAGCVTRRGFLEGAAAAFCSLFGGRLFAVPSGWRPAKVPNLVFGVVSDTHLRTTVQGAYSTGYWADRWFVAALRDFRDQNVDAVVHLGDMAHVGQVEEMAFHRAAWEKVFPRDLAPDGHKVARLFVAGNHDLDGSTYGIGELVKRLYPDPEVRKQHLLCTDIARHWERIWDEKYEPVWHRVLKGYHFFGRHYAGKNFNEDEAKVAALVKEVDAASPLAKDKNPFFILSHIRSHAAFNRAMLGYPNAVSFFGHWHASAANWNVIRMRGASPSIQCPSCAPMGSNSLSPDSCKWAKAPFTGADAAGKNRQGYVVRLYDDMMVVNRREFGQGGSLGPDWMMPLGEYAPHPFAPSELKKAIGEPQFRTGAALCTETAEAQALRVKIPPADANPDSRVFAYEVRVEAEGGKLCKLVYAAGCNLAAGHEPDGGVTKLDIPKEELPPGGKWTVSVRPASSLGTFGKALKHLASLALVAALSLARPPCAEAAVALLEPKDASTFETLTDAQLTVFAGATRTNRCEIGKRFPDDKQNRTVWRCQRPLVLKWKTTEGETGPWRVRLSRKPDFAGGGDLWVAERDAKGVKLEDGSEVWTYTVPRANLELGATYHWQVWSNVKCSEFRCGFTYPETCRCGKSKAGHVSRVSTFRTSEQPPRWIALEGRVRNIRDIGGWPTEDGGRVRTGLVYRGNGLNDSSFAGLDRGRNRLTVEDVRYLTEVLGIKTDLDLRCPREVAGMDGSPLGPKVAFVNIEARSYKELFTPEGRRITARLFRLFCDRKNYPVYFHCIHGADRTGSLAYLLDGFLGVTREDLERDWESTCYPRVRGVDTPDDWRSCAFFDAGFAAYGKPGDPLSERIRLYLLDCGVTPQELDACRAILKEQPAGGAGSAARNERGTMK